MDSLLLLVPHQALVLLLLGALAGFLAGLIGIGGGFVLVPGLQALFSMEPEMAGKVMPMVLGTTTACMIFTAVSSTRPQLKRNAV